MCSLESYYEKHKAYHTDAVYWVLPCHNESISFSLMREDEIPKVRVFVTNYLTFF